MTFNANRLKVQLKLAQTRLKMLQHKKANQSAGERREIAKLLNAKKEESARIRVEHIIHDDYMMEAMELLELFCDLLLARFGMIEQLKLCDDSIKEPVCSLIWAAPRMMTSVDEFRAIRDLLVAKYGKEFALAAVENKGNCVSERLMRKFDIGVPDPKLVDSYLTEIAKSHNVQWRPAEPEDAFERDDIIVDEPVGSPQQGTTGSMSNLDILYPPSRSAGQSYPPPAQPAPDAGRPPGPPDSLGLPPPPPDTFAGPDEDGPDFDDLAKRFSALKKRR